MSGFSFITHGCSVAWNKPHQSSSWQASPSGGGIDSKITAGVTPSDRSPPNSDPRDLTHRKEGNKCQKRKKRENERITQNSKKITLASFTMYTVHIKYVNFWLRIPNCSLSVQNLTLCLREKRGLPAVGWNEIDTFCYWGEKNLIEKTTFLPCIVVWSLHNICKTMILLGIITDIIWIKSNVNACN